jgi:hypothetical protein
MPFIALAVALGLLGLAIGFALMLAVIVIVGGGIGLVVYSLYLHNAPEGGVRLPKEIPYLEYWEIGIGASLIMLIIGIEMLYGVGVFYDRAAMASLSPSNLRWYFAWYVLGHIIFGFSLLASVGYLAAELEKGASLWPAPPDKVICYYTAYIGAASGATFIFVQWPRLSTFGLIFIVLPVGVYLSVTRSIAKDRSNQAQQTRNAKIEELRAELQSVSEDEFVKNVLG